MITSVSTGPATARAKQNLTARPGDGFGQTKRGTRSVHTGVPRQAGSLLHPSPQRCTSKPLTHRAPSFAPSNFFLLSFIVWCKSKILRHWADELGRNRNSECTFMDTTTPAASTGHWAAIQLVFGRCVAYTHPTKRGCLLLCEHRVCLDWTWELQAHSRMVPVATLHDAPLTRTDQCRTSAADQIWPAGRGAACSVSMEHLHLEIPAKEEINVVVWKLCTYIFFCTHCFLHGNIQNFLVIVTVLRLNFRTSFFSLHFFLCSVF